MKICLILEGCYPYVFGGVATWVNEYILSKPEHEFILLTIGAHKKDRGKFVYEIPKNVVEIKEVFMDEVKDKMGIKRKKKYDIFFQEEIKNIILGKKVNWNIIFRTLQNKYWSSKSFFKSEAYMKIIEDVVKLELKENGISGMFYGIKSMLMPLFELLVTEIPEADIYHSACTGYAGILGAIAQYKKRKPLIVTEHGIYPREREEEILVSNWIGEKMKNIWIKFFYSISQAAYDKAVIVTSLFENAKNTQIMLGCNPNKCEVVSNGIHLEKYALIPDKEKDGYIDIGAFIRFSSIKDVKTLLYAFYETWNKSRHVRLHIFGSTNDKEYEKQCLNIIETLGMSKCVRIYGQINPLDYMPHMDFTILTSISEGQPLTILESFAARRPVICTNVGSCKELITGNNDEFGKAGICCVPMDITGIANAMKKMCDDEKLRKQYGLNGMRRVQSKYKFEEMMKNYFNLYEKGLKIWQA